MILLPLALVALAFFVVTEVRLQKGARVEPSMAHMSNGSRHVVFALARVEGKRLLRHPAMLVGYALSAFGIFVVGAGAAGILHRDEWTLTLFNFPLAGMTLIATNLATLRSRRDGCDELYDTLPVSRDARTLGHHLTAFWGIAAAIVVTGIQVAYTYVMGAIGRPAIADTLTGPVLVGCAAVVGVTAARLVPNPVIGPVAVVLMGMFQGLVDHFSGPSQHLANWFAPLVEDAVSSDLLARRDVSHLIYVIGLGGFAASLGVIRHRRDRRALAGLAVALSVIATGGLIQSRPYSAAELDVAASFVAHPERVQTCKVLRGVTYCAYPGYEDLMPQWARTVDGVLARVPSRQALSIRQRIPAQEIEGLPEAILTRLPAGVPTVAGATWPSDGAIHPNLNWCGRRSYSCELSLGVAAASWATGLPLDPTRLLSDPNDPYAAYIPQGYDASGQARAVVALWLGAGSTPGAREHFLKRLRNAPIPQSDAHEVPTYQGEPVSNVVGAPFPIHGCDGVTEPGTRFAPTDALYAAALLELPDAEVERAVRANWQRLADPATPTAELVRLFKLKDPGSLKGLYVNC